MFKFVSQIGLLALISASSAQYTAQVLPTPTGRGIAGGVGGGQIVGDALDGTGGWPCLWDITTRTFTSLVPIGYEYAQALGVGGGNQVGHGFVDNDMRALIWSGSAASAVDL